MVTKMSKNSRRYLWVLEHREPVPGRKTQWRWAQTQTVRFYKKDFPKNLIRGGRLVRYEPIKPVKKIIEPVRCSSCGHAAHGYYCSDETYNGFSCRCKINSIVK